MRSARCAARGAISSTVISIMRRAGMLRTRPRRYRATVASRAAIVSLSTRRARKSGFLRIRARGSRLPVRMPACGPPRSLSPLKVATSTPERRLGPTAGSSATPSEARSIRQPLPKSSSRIKFCLRASSTISFSAGRSVKPTIRKLLG